MKTGGSVRSIDLSKKEHSLCEILRAMMGSCRFFSRCRQNNETRAFPRNPTPFPPTSLQHIPPRWPPKIPRRGPPRHLTTTPINHSSNFPGSNASPASYGTSPTASPAKAKISDFYHGELWAPPLALTSQATAFVSATTCLCNKACPQISASLPFRLASTAHVIHQDRDGD